MIFCVDPSPRFTSVASNESHNGDPVIITSIPFPSVSIVNEFSVTVRSYGAGQSIVLIISPVPILVPQVITGGVISPWFSTLLVPQIPQYQVSCAGVNCAKNALVRLRLLLFTVNVPIPAERFWL